MTRAGRASDTPVASSPVVIALARMRHSRKLPRPSPSHSRERCAWVGQPEMSSVGREPSPRNALSNVRLRFSPSPRFGHREGGSRRLFTRPAPFGIRAGQAPVRASRCLRESRFSGPRHRSPTSATERRAGTPYERPILTRERGFRLATRRHQPMPVALASTTRCRTGDLRATTCTRRLTHAAFHLRGRGKSWAEAFERRRDARSWTMSRVPSS